MKKDSLPKPLEKYIVTSSIEREIHVEMLMGVKDGEIEWKKVK